MRVSLSACLEALVLEAFLEEPRPCDAGPVMDDQLERVDRSFFAIIINRLSFLMNKKE